MFYCDKNQMNHIEQL